MASTLNNIGEVYHLQGSFAKAIEFYTRSLELEVKFKDTLGVGESLLNIGVAYQQSLNYNEGLKYNRKALETFPQNGQH